MNPRGTLKEVPRNHQGTAKEPSGNPCRRAGRRAVMYPGGRVGTARHEKVRYGTVRYGTVGQQSWQRQMTALGAVIQRQLTALGAAIQRQVGSSRVK